MYIEFKTNKESYETGQILMLGLYELPIKRDIYDNMNRVSRMMENQGAPKEAFDERFFKDTAVNNIFKTFVLETKDLRSLLSALPAVPAGKQRMLFITSCRPPSLPADHIHIPAVTAALRRRSIGSRHNAGPVLSANGEKAFRELEEYRVLYKYSLLDTSNPKSILPRPNIVWDEARFRGLGVEDGDIPLLRRAFSRRNIGKRNDETFRPLDKALKPKIGPALPPSHLAYQLGVRY
jgi:hypothetical protein